MQNRWVKELCHMEGEGGREDISDGPQRLVYTKDLFICV